MFTIPFFYFILKFYVNPSLKEFSVGFLEKYKMITISARLGFSEFFQLLLSGPRSLGSEHPSLALLIRSESSHGPAGVRQLAKEASPQVCFQGYVRITGGAIWVSQGNLMSRLWSQRGGNSTPIAGVWEEHCACRRRCSRPHIESQRRTPVCTVRAPAHVIRRWPAHSQILPVLGELRSSCFDNNRAGEVSSLKGPSSGS